MTQRNIEVKIIKDSVNPNGKRITTMLMSYPRFIHSELMTHRMLSRNAASSRAVPVQKVIELLRDDPAVPEWWGAAQSGMQAESLMPEESIQECKAWWEQARDRAIGFAEMMHGEGCHKQIVNRILEPWSRMTVLVTATEWDNFFALRAHPAAQPEFQVLAYRVLDAYLKSTPDELEWDQWHIPFDPGNDYPDSDRLAVSVACAARTSYVAFDADKSVEEQRVLANRLSASGHWSPFEHQAKADPIFDLCLNFSGGWMQHRFIYKDQNRTKVNLQELLNAKPDWIEL